MIELRNLDRRPRGRSPRQLVATGLKTIQHQRVKITASFSLRVNKARPPRTIRQKARARIAAHFQQQRVDARVWRLQHHAGHLFSSLVAPRQRVILRLFDRALQSLPSGAHAAAQPACAASIPNCPHSRIAPYNRPCGKPSHRKRRSDRLPSDQQKGH